MRPTELLREEHCVILRALTLLEAAAGRLESGEAVSDQWWSELVAWLRGFADARHHAKEERVLFPALVRAGVPSEGGPVGAMLAEHVLGRAYIAAMADGLPEHRAAEARQYLHLLRDHIEKEDLVLFPLAEDVLEPAAMDAVTCAFADADAGLDRALTLEAADAALRRLAASLEVLVAAPS